MMLGPSLALVLIMALPQPPAQETKPPAGRISGRVVASDTGKPIRWARVSMTSAQGRPFNATTDAEGRFQFGGLVPGTYRLDASAERYLRMYFGGQPYTGLSAAIPRSITIRDGEAFDKADVALPRGGAIDGRLVDEFGDPAPGLIVQISELVYAGGRRRLMPIGNRSLVQPTDDRGYFRLHGLSPGTYYLSALSGAFAEQAETGGFAPTYYPGTSDVAAATPLRLAVGQELTLTFPVVPARMARLSGRVVDSTGAAVSRATLTMSTGDRLGISDFNITRGVTEPDGTFVFRNVPPGTFTLQGYGAAVAPGGNLGVAEFGWLPLVVDGNDQAGLVLRVAAGPSLKGRVTAEDPGASFNARAAGVRVATVPIEFDSAPVGGGPPPFTLADDGTFEVKNMSGKRIIRVSVQDPGWMLKRIVRQSRDITDEAVDCTAGEIAGIDVILTNRVTSVSGSVTDAQGNRADDFAVVIFATDPARWTDRSRFIASARPTQDGSFTVRALPPDEYFAVALPGLRGTEWQDPDFLKTLQERASRFFLGDGEQKTISLRIAER